MAVLASTLIMLMLAAAVPVMAQGRSDSPAFTVRNVVVDRTAATAAAAREAALVDGQRTALRRLFERLVPRSEYRRLPNPSDSRISDLVENFEVQSERTSAVRYIASLTYRFRPDDVRNLLRNANIPFAETYAKPYLVLPVLHDQGVALLWDDPNPWRAAWARAAPFDGLAPLILPKGDLADVSDINADQARAGDDQRLTAISRRYGVAGVYVADAVLDSSDTGRTLLQVTLSVYGAAMGEQTMVDSYVAAAGEDNDALMQRAAVETTRGIEERWKSEQLLQFGREAALTVSVSFDDVAQWVAIRRRLADLALIRRSDIVSLTRHQAILTLGYIGDDGQLRVALAQRDLELLPADAGSGAAGAQWQLKLTASANSDAATRPASGNRP
jgi:Uncharacterized protein conserved in bacteria (DUF2066)